MTADEFTTCWIPLPIPARHIHPGDTIVGHNDRLWLITDTTRTTNGVHERLATSGVGEPYPMPVTDIDPDELFQVLTPIPMAQALALTKAELAAHTIERRT